MRDFVTSSGVTMVKARRAHSLPSYNGGAFVLPSDEMGEYDEVGGGLGPSRRRSAPARGTMLYPLREEGTYGRPPTDPAKPAPPKDYVRRERKPKIYSSYAVKTDCSIHGGSIAKMEHDHGQEHIDRRRRRASNSSSSASGRRPSWASRGSPAPGRRTVSASPSRRTSASPEPSRKFSGGRMPNQGYNNSGSNNKAWSTSSSSSSSSNSYSGGNNNRYSSSSYSYSYRNGGGSNLRNSSFEENEEYEYEENQRIINGKPPLRGGFGKYAPSTTDLGRRLDRISLEGMRKPKVNSWDSMGVLGLSNKMWSDTRKRQESFLETTGHFLREENGSYIM